MHSENQGLVTNLEEWKREYKKDKTQVWVIITLSDDSQYFFKNSTKQEFEDWHKIVKIAREGGLSVKEVGLRYRSNIYRQEVKADGLYLTRSALGTPGGETIGTMTIGLVLNEQVSKTIVQLPALVVMDTYDDSLDNCFEEATWIWKKS